MKQEKEQSIRQRIIAAIDKAEFEEAERKRKDQEEEEERKRKEQELADGIV